MHKYRGITLNTNQAKAVDKALKGENLIIQAPAGSGKTLTSYKASQILSRNPDIKKVLFVVDRKDLDIQTTKEFNSFSDGSVDGTDNTVDRKERDQYE